MAPSVAFQAKKAFAVMATLTAALMLGACAQDGENLQAGLLDPKSPAKTEDTASAEATSGAPQSELEKATEYWGKKYKAHPNDAEAAVSYVKNLKAMGERQQALAVVQQATSANPGDKKLASEYGRLALELDQISVAKQMLALADDPTSPDWRVISAKGTIFAKEGKFADAIPLYERALMLSQEQTSVMNNLAMAYAMAGEAGKAEEMLRRIEAKGGNAKSRQNLALVLGLQGKFDESKAVSAQAIGADGAKADNDYLRRMVKVDKSANASTGLAVASGGDVAPLISKASASTVQGGKKPFAVAPDTVAQDEGTSGSIVEPRPVDGQPPLKGMAR